MLSGFFILHCDWPLPADKCGQLVRVVCKRKFPSSDYPLWKILIKISTEGVSISCGRFRQRSEGVSISCRRFRQRFPQFGSDSPLWKILIKISIEGVTVRCGRLKCIFHWEVCMNSCELTHLALLHEAPTPFLVNIYCRPTEDIWSSNKIAQSDPYFQEGTE